jgi:lactose/L-arabinose transport system substrate-binding protein
MEERGQWYRASRRVFLTGMFGCAGAVLIASCRPGQSPAATPPVTAGASQVAPTATSGGASATPAGAATPTSATPAATAVPRVSPQAAGAFTPSPATGTLTFWGHQDHPMDRAVDGFQKRFPNIKMNWQHLGDWLTKFKATLASGQDVPDLVWLEATDVQNFGAQGVLLDITEHLKPIKDQFSPGKVSEVFIVKKQQYVAMPGDIGLVGLWYRQDLLDKAGVQLPENLSYDQFIEIAAQLHQKAGEAAFLLPSSGWSWPFEIILSQAGGSITSLDGTQVTIDDEKGIEAMTLVKRLWDTKANLDTAWLKPDYWAAVKAGKIATDFMPAWMRGFCESELKSPEDGLGKWKVMPLPTVKDGISRTAQIGGASLASTKFTKIPDVVWEFMHYALGTMEGATAVGGWGIIPSYLPYLTSENFTGIKSTVFGDFQFGKVWAQLAQELSPRYARTAVFSEADQFITQDMMPILTGKISIVEGMHALASKIRQANQRYQY